MNDVQTFVLVVMNVFLRKSLKICLGSSLLFRSLTFDCFSVQFTSFVTRPSNFLSNSKSEKGHEIGNRLPISKMSFNYPISHRNIKVPE